MTIAANPDTGEAFYLDNNNTWQPAKMAVNPQTKQMYAFDGKAWQAVNVHSHGFASYMDDAVKAIQSGMNRYFMQGVPADQRTSQANEAEKTINDVGRSVASGASFGYADRLAAEAGSLTGVGGKKGDYAGNLAAQQARTAQVPAAISVPGQIAGSAAAVAAAPVAGIAEGIPAAAKAILGGAAAGGLYGSSQGNTAQERIKNAEIGAATGGATGGLVHGLGAMIGKAGDKIMTSVIKPSIADVKDGFNINTVKEFGLGGSLRTTLQKTQSAISDLSNQLREKLAASNARIDLTSVYDKTEKTLTAAGKDKLKSFGAQQSIKASLDRLQNEVLLATNGQPLSIPDAQIIKQAAGNFGAWQYGRPDPDSKASEIVYNQFYHNLKTAIEQQSPSGVKEINQKLSKLIPVSNAVIRRLPVADRNNIISFPEMIGIMGSVVHPRIAGATMVNLLSRSGRVGAGLSSLSPSLAAPRVGAAVGAGASTLGQSVLSSQQ